MLIAPYEKGRRWAAYFNSIRQNWERHSTKGHALNELKSAPAEE